MKKIILVLSLLAWASNGPTQPADTMQSLIKEPASLLDLGLYRLESELRDFRFNNLELFRDNSAQVVYDRKTQRVAATMVIYPESDSFSPAPQGNDFSKICRDAMGQLKDHYLARSEVGQSRIAFLFTSSGSDHSEAGAAWDSDIAASVDIEIAVASSRKNRPPLTIEKRCSSGLLEEEIQFLQ
jgi:hypothetical protein